ncbi:cancer/testis antigen 47A-like [Mesoplodon densirostris]|uniref:cancer/testis antigen 47A-like n=1 Tax=Mesoplodon densirostris TaxID=48708 RepID=UPI0028DB32BD|nr:cancer/testis antigen 47A-like [Mesoplodon densirostris]
MSATGEGDPAPGGPEGPAGAAGAQVETARAGDRVDRDSEPRGGDAVPGAWGGAGEVALEGRGAEEDSDNRPAEEEEEEEEAGGLDRVVEEHWFPMTGFRFVCLELVSSLLRRIYYNHHILVPTLLSWHHAGRGERPTAQEPEEAEEAEAGLPKSVLLFTKETTKYQDENVNEEAQGAKSEGEREKFNKKQEPEKDLNPAGQTQKVHVALKITQRFPGAYQFCFRFSILPVN